jgi:hypothetical protein
VGQARPAANCMSIRSGFTQRTDEFFFTASNQIVNDLRRPLLPSLMMPEALAGLETFTGDSAPWCFYKHLSRPENFE